MTSSTRRAFLAAVAATAAAGPAFAAADKTVPCDKVFPFLENYLKIPAAERNRFTVAYYLMVDGKAPKGLQGWLGTGATRTAVPIGADGKVQRLPTLAQLKAKTPLTFDGMEAAKFSINMVVEPLMRPAVEIKAAELSLAVAQAAKGAKKAAGLMAVAVPKLDRVLFKGVSAGTVVHADGKTTPMTVVKGSPVFDPEKQKTAATLRFARAPSQMLIGSTK
ncbi:MAG TPA: hypothetical protein VEA15_10285 [Caulobacteraceae bacterium]|nr:hypothetical protein [Caulobacteraceae bacterium]